MIKEYYTQKLKNGECPYKLIYFEIDLLRNIIDNPRYVISHSSVKFDISIREEYNNDAIDEKYKFCLSNIGLGFDENNERIFAVLLKELSGLHPDMQKRFCSYEVKKKTYIDPAYIKSMNDGEWANPSVFEAILYQIKKINEICSNNDVTLFKSEDNNPIEFNILLLSTKEEYDNFIKKFDIMLSDNLNEKFFKRNLDLTKVTNKRTISLFKEWMDEIGVSKDTIEKIINIIKEVRKERSIASHNYRDNEFDMKYIQKQKEIILEVYNTFRLLIDELSKINQINITYSEWYVKNRILIHSLNEINGDNENYQLKICQSNEL